MAHISSEHLDILFEVFTIATGICQPIAHLSVAQIYFKAALAKRPVYLQTDRFGFAKAQKQLVSAH
jgi:hypothetical protein